MTYWIITFASCAVIFFLRYLASNCNAKMDTVTNKFNGSIYAGKEREWFDPRSSYMNKYLPQVWQTRAKPYLPRIIYIIANAIKPAYDPVSDFWHWEKTKMIVLDSFSFLIGAVATFFLTRLNHSFIIAVPILLMYVSWVAGWNLTFNYNLKKLLK